MSYSKLKKNAKVCGKKGEISDSTLSIYLKYLKTYDFVIKIEDKYYYRPNLTVRLTEILKGYPIPSEEDFVKEIITRSLKKEYENVQKSKESKLKPLITWYDKTPGDHSIKHDDRIMTSRESFKKLYRKNPLSTLRK